MREVTPTRLRHVARNKIEKSTGEPAPFIGLEDVAAGAGRLATEELEPKAATDALVFAPGDVLFSKLRPYLAKSLAPEISGTCTSELLVMRPGPELDRRYLLYMSLSVPWLEWAITTSYGTKMPRTSWEAMADFAFGLPSLEEQRRIADFLDTETTRLDQVLQAREQQSALLAVREGLRCQEIIDSLAGAEHVPLRRFLRSITDGPFGSSLKSSHYSTDGARVIRLGNVGTAEFVDHDQAFIPIDYFETLRAHSVREGDVVVAGLGDASRPVGRACVVPDIGPAIVKADCFRLRFDQARLLHEYAAVAISAPRVTARTSTLSRGSTRTRINTDIAREVAIPVPPLSTQRSIIAATSELRAHHAGLRSAFERQASRLREKRQALITAAVTGAVDVTTAQRAS